MTEERHPGGRARVFNAPRVVLVSIALLAAIHAARGLLNPATDDEFVLTFAFIPARYAPPAGLIGQIPGGEGAAVWSFVTHALLHGDWLHLGINALWMLAFGSVVARRLGTIGFLVLSLVSAAAGALANLLVHWGEVSVLVGASGAISGQMAAAVRLMFAEGGSLGTIHTRRLESVRPLSLAATFADPRALVFILVWFGITLFTGIGSLGPPGEEIRIAWEAHVGGFLAGLLSFGWLDARRLGAPR